MDSLNVIVKEFLKENGISVKHFAKCIGADYTVCCKWIDGKRNLNAEKLKKVHKFLQGEYMKSVEELVKNN